MKIGIYGDSHAANVYPISVNDDISYIEMLYKKYNITNFGQRGSSLFFSYHTFFTTHREFDKIIFLATFPGRIYLDPKIHSKIDFNLLHITGSFQAELYAKRYSDSPEIAKVFNAVKDYLLYARNESQEYIFHDLMLREIKVIRPDAILIDTLKFSGPVDTDFIFWNILDRTDVFVKYDDTRHCHMSQEKHYILYEMIEDSIKTGKEIDHSRLSNVKPSKTFEDYFKIQDNKLEFILVEKFKEQFK